ncbi:MAG TPA: NAD(P)/FAD-dependent oxidoreductase [Acidimicrobiales bacterium]|nr:NAD(P)/FAD-dependent oxidoreductase [Acidimicrobiales bacterium]
MPDAVIIGSGPNGLVAANLLADEGWDVVVLEATATPGGAVQSAELIEPGYVNDVFSAFYPLAAASPVMRTLNLERHGVRWRHAPLVLAHPALDGTCPVISRDLDETAASLDAYSPGDGAAWRRLFALWERIGPPMTEALMDPFPPVRAGLKTLGRLRPSEIVRFARFMLLPVRRMAEEEFDGEPARRLLAGNALHTDLFPESTLSGLFGWLLACLGQDVGWPVPEGGAGALTNALVRRLEQSGGKVLVDHPVAQVVVRNGRATAVRTHDGTEFDARRAIVADVNAPFLYLDLVGTEHLPSRAADDIRRFQWDNPTVKVDWNLDGPIPWTAEPARRAGTVHVAESIDALTRTSVDLATGQIPADPFLILGQQSMTDPTRQPAGKETAWAYTHVPARTLDAEAVADRMEERVEELAPGFRGLIRGRHILSPSELQSRNPNLRGGATNGGTAQLHQQVVFRPTPGLGRAETPIGGLYLGSSSAHPGGGVHGACGANAAKAALWARRTRR